MEKLLSAESIMVLVALLMPGFIYGRVKNWVTQRIDDEKPTVATEIYRHLVRSLVMLMVIFPLGFGLPAIARLIRAIQANNLVGMFGSMPDVLTYAMMLIVGPGVLGCIVGMLEIKEVTGWARKAIGLPPVMLNQAWDVAMARAGSDRDRIIVDVVLKDGGTILGRYGQNSAASRSGGYRDLYLEELWTVNNGALVPAEGGSILIRGADIRSVRFIRIPA
ncbi:DUF6338 family protein [Rhodanobacter sp. FW106-PBR-R2A-1-13]|uniref:DUF6338 family protein n=1 Tax=Rhodanobacter sp. FW106-PBR-R2A-1-13 TaxID=3454845 RepID=UPI0034E5E0D2